MLVPLTLPMACGHCGLEVAAEVIYIEGMDPRDLATPGLAVPPISALWMRCPSCGEGSVRTRAVPYKGSVIYPGVLPGRMIPNLPSDVDTAWKEARASHSVGAYTASEIMCRKILMHMAVGVAGSAPGKHFIEYVNDLEAGGYIMAGLKPVVDQIRERGNKANHELPASGEHDSLTTLTITQHLLSGIYELPSLAPTPPQSLPPTPPQSSSGSAP